ncbi:MAG: NDP-sugar synthase [Capsulimonadales bacterium]|nr:NDP-sugar synthase [Capsulimonadales bacterium]
MKAMILAAGEGTRLRPLTLALPKPMVPLVSVPLLTRTLRLLRAQGVTEIAANLFYRPEAIRAELGTGESLGVRLRFSEESVLMGTAGGVRRLAEFLDETFLVLYGDNLYAADFAPLIAFHRRKGATATMATFTAPNPSACGLVLTDGSGRVTRFQEKPPPDQVFTDQANAGVYVLEPGIFDVIPPGTVCDFGKDIFPRLLVERPGSLFARPLDGYLQDTGTIPAYRQANWDLLEGRAGPPERGVHPTAVIAEAALLLGRNVVGPGTRVGKGATLIETIVWENCRIGEKAMVREAILGRGVTVGAGATVGADSVLADGVNVAPGETVPPGSRLS